MLDYYEIGQRIRYYRKEAGLSQEKLAEQIGISTTHMSHIETGNTKMSLAVLAELSMALQVSADRLLFAKPRESAALSDMEHLLSACSEPQAQKIVELARNMKSAFDQLSENEQ